MLAAANMRIGSADDADSLLGQLAAANARIGSADDADSLLGQIAALTARVAALQGGTDPVVLDPIKERASGAATAAGEAATAAGEAADAAEIADDNRADFQTGDADSGAAAMAARYAADKAAARGQEGFRCFRHGAGRDERRRCEASHDGSRDGPGCGDEGPGRQPKHRATRP